MSPSSMDAAGGRGGGEGDEGDQDYGPFESVKGIPDWFSIPAPRP